MQATAILRLVFEDVGPALAQPRQERRIEAQRLQRQADEVVEVHRAAIGQRALVVGVDRVAHFEQRQRFGELVQPVAQVGRRELQVFGLLDEAGRQPGDVILPAPTAHALRAGFVQLGREDGVQAVRMTADPGLGRVLQDLRRRALVDDLEIVGEAGQRRTLAHDVVRQAVQRAHPVADVGQQPPLLHEARHPPGEVAHGRVHQRDDQHFLLVAQIPLGDQLRRQQR